MNRDIFPKTKWYEERIFVSKTIALVGTFLLMISISLAACKGPANITPELDLDEEGIPPINPPTIDGIIDPQEWDAAAVQLFADGSEIYFMVSSSDLYVAIRNIEGGMIAGNVFLEQGDRVFVMHSSAALGTAIYQKEGDDFRKIKDFVWCCRSKIDDETSRSARKDFYDEEGWLGGNSFIGAENELEYLISLDGSSARMAVNFILADGGGEKQVWPVGLEDGVAQPAAGGFPDLIAFALDEWISLEDIQ
jgi:hypothetical protein